MFKNIGGFPDTGLPGDMALVEWKLILLATLCFMCSSILYSLQKASISCNVVSYCTNTSSECSSLVLEFEAGAWRSILLHLQMLNSKTRMEIKEITWVVIWIIIFFNKGTNWKKSSFWWWLNHFLKKFRGSFLLCLSFVEQIKPQVTKDQSWLG